MALARANAVRVYLNIEHKPRLLKVTPLMEFCAYVTTLQNHPPLFVKKKQDNLARSFVLVQEGLEKIAFLTLGERIYPEVGAKLTAPYVRVSASAMVVFGKDGKVKEVVDTVKIFAEFDPQDLQKSGMMLRRLLMMQYLKGKEFPPNFGFFTYKNSKGRQMVAIFQKRFSKDLHHLYEKTHGYRDLSLDEQVHFARAAVDAVSRMHSLGVMHRDVKMQNFLIGSEDELLLTDLEFASAFDDSEMTKKPCGSLQWAAPEVLNFNPEFSQPISKESDIWSLGFLLYSLTGDTHPLMQLRMDVYGLKALKGRLEGISETLKAAISDPASTTLQKVCLYLYSRIGQQIPFRWRLEAPTPKISKRHSSPVLLAVPSVETRSMLSKKLTREIRPFLALVKKCRLPRNGQTPLEPFHIDALKRFLEILLEEDIAAVIRRIQHYEKVLSSCSSDYDREQINRKTVAGIANAMLKTNPADRLNLDAVKAALREIEQEEPEPAEREGGCVQS